jgi:photosystem II stability/assembly factor-like uncharacterized protein
VGWSGPVALFSTGLAAASLCACGTTVTKSTANLTVIVSISPTVSATGEASTPAAPSTEPSPVPGILASPVGTAAAPRFVELSVPSTQVVWILIDGNLFRSINGGTQWEPRPVPPGHFPGPDISFISDQEGWLATGGVPATQCQGAGTAVWHTDNAGATWQQVASVSYDKQLRGDIGFSQCKEGLSFVDASHGFLGAWDPNSPPTIWRTGDGGKTWAAVRLPDPPGFVNLGAGDTLRAGVVREFGNVLLIPAWGMQPSFQTEHEYVFRSVDYGRSWGYIATNGSGLNNVTFVSATRWVKLSNDGSGQETTDAGKTWHAYSSGYRDSSADPSSFAFADPLVCYGTVDGRIQKTVDGGLHWVQMKPPGA